jgi:predicted membrane chloride channel (bestrophin family)
MTTVVIGGVLALLLVLFFLRQPTSLPLASNESGQLLISRRALHRMVEACCEQVRGVASANASINIKGEQFNTRLRLKVRPEAKLDAIQGYLTQEITNIYRENLGLSSEIGQIEIKVVGVIPAEPNF